MPTVPATPIDQVIEPTCDAVEASVAGGKRICLKCEQPKSEAEFHKSPRARDGLSNLCGECHRAITLGAVFTLSNKQAAEVMNALEAGKTLRRIAGGGRFGKPICSLRNFRKHCELFPEWGLKANELADVNRQAADKLKGDSSKSFAFRTHCSRGHALTPENIYLKSTNGTRQCRACNIAAVARGAPMTKRKEELVRRAVLTGMSISDITGARRSKHRQIVSNGTLKNFRLQNPEFNRFIIENICERSRKTLLSSMGVAPIDRSLLRFSSAPVENGHQEIPLYVPEPGDIEWLYSLTPRSMSEADRWDVASDITVALLERRLRKEDVPQRIREFTGGHRKLFAGGEYGSVRAPLSLDVPIFLDGKTTRIEAVSIALWSEQSINS